MATQSSRAIGRSDRHLIRDMLWKLQDALDANLAALEHAATPESVHDVRVTVRRLRAALRALRHHLSPRLRKRYSTALQQLATDLEAARNADVRELVVNALIARTKFLDYGQSQRLLRMVAEQRTSARRNLRTVMRTKDWTRRAEERRRLSRSLQVIAFPDPPLEAIRRILMRRDRRLWKKLRHMGRKPRKLHRLRLRIKEARYLNEDLGALLDLPYGTTLLRLRQLQNRLGEFHDNWTLRKWLHLQDRCRPLAHHLIQILDERQKRLLEKLRRRRKAPAADRRGFSVSPATRRTDS